LKDGIRGGLGDYAANIGTTGFDFTVILPNGDTIPANGVFEFDKGIRIAEILDGTSNTLLIGEKNVPLNMFGSYPLDCGIYDGHNPVCNTRAAGPSFPLSTSYQDQGWKFGSYHPSICQFVFCDGAVRPIVNSINPYVLGLLAQRNDGQVIPDY
jgi:hypothetical protein